MPRLIEKSVPFKPVKDPKEVASDPLVKRALLLFDCMRRRGVGQERSAFVVANVFQKGGSDSGNAK